MAKGKTSGGLPPSPTWKKKRDSHRAGEDSSERLSDDVELAARHGGGCGRRPVQLAAQLLGESHRLPLQLRCLGVAHFHPHRSRR